MSHPEKYAVSKQVEIIRVYLYFKIFYESLHILMKPRYYSETYRKKLKIAELL